MDLLSLLQRGDSMAIFFYTDADRTQIVTMNPATADGITLSSGDTGALTSTKITFEGLGDLYYSTKYDSSIFWARSIKFTNASIFDAETISDLYTPDGFRVHIGVTKTGEGVYSLSGAFAVYKPDGTIWKNGQTTTVRITDAESDKKLRIILCQLTYTLYGGGTMHGYYLMPGWVRITQALPPEILYIMSGNGVWFNDAFFSKSETDPQGGIPQEPEGGDGSHSLTGGALDTGTAAGRSSDMGGGGINTGAHGTHVYEITGAAFDSFMQTIYGQGSSTFDTLWQQFKNFNHDPLSGILSAFIIPISAPGSLVTAVTLSGQQIAISGGTCKAISQRFVETEETTIPIPGYHNSFLDYAPYTKVSLYLPFVGTVSVNTNECMRGSISIKYWVDVCTGECVAYVDLVDWNGYHTYYNYSGNCAGPAGLWVEDSAELYQA